MQTNMKLECKRADVDMDQLRKSLDEEKRKLKLEKEVSNEAHLKVGCLGACCLHKLFFIPLRGIKVLSMSVKSSRKN